MPLRFYPELFALVGSHVPDFRGLFLRGHGGASGALGIKQEQQTIVGEHFHYTFADTESWTALNDKNEYVAKNGHSPAGVYDANMHANGTMQIATLGKTSGIVKEETEKEIRPVNTAVRYLIRARS